MGQPENAIDAFNHVVAIDKRDDTALVNLATCYSIKRDFQRAVYTYRQAFALDPDDMFGMFVNGEYGAALMQTGRLADAQDAFDKMAASKSSLARARGLRSLAFLDMYRGRYASAIARLREAIPLNQAALAIVSVYRDRLILVHAMLATGRTEDAKRELSAIDALLKKEAFGPEWLVNLAKTYARMGNVRDAGRIAALMPAGIGNTVVASSANRNTTQDQAFYEIAQAEVAIAQKKPAEGVSLATQAAGRLEQDRSTALDTLAFASAAAGRTDDARAKYEDLVSHPRLGSEEQEEWFDAQLALGRIYEQIGRPADARRLYEQVSTTWKDGDADLVRLNTARARAAALSR
jgi:tetratricopeptide (TPR) repeat protein